MNSAEFILQLGSIFLHATKDTLWLTFSFDGRLYCFLVALILFLEFLDFGLDTIPDCNSCLHCLEIIILTFNPQVQIGEVVLLVEHLHECLL